MNKKDNGWLQHNVDSMDGRALWTELISAKNYDFYIKQYNVLIEFQGAYHDGTVSNCMQNEKELERQREHDRRKRQYALDNGYDLLEIWYYDIKNTENIIKQHLNL